MFILFGWDKQTSKHFGPVLPHLCENCKNEEYWQLYRVQRWFTLFFIPIFPHASESLIICPICNASSHLDSYTFKLYKSIAKIHKNHANKILSDDQAKKEIDILLNEINQKEETKRLKHSEENSKFTSIVQLKSDKELIEIMSSPIENYNPSFLISVEKEIKKRKL